MTRESVLRDEMVLPLHAEEIAITKDQVVTGKVRVATVTREREARIDEFLTRQEVEIERKPIGKLVDRVPPVRQRGETIIVPVVEEVVTVVRRLVLKEELRIRRINKREKHKQRVTIRRQEVLIERLPAATRSPPGNVAQPASLTHE
jgi:uncharacterized protein (TIGR02271 family)